MHRLSYDSMLVKHTRQLCKTGHAYSTREAYVDLHMRTIMLDCHQVKHLSRTQGVSAWCRQPQVCNRTLKTVHTTAM